MTEAALSTQFGIRLDPADVRRFHAAGLWRAATLIDDFRAAVARRPDKEAIVEYSPERTALTYQHLSDAVDQIAANLIAAGIAAGDRICFQLPNRWEFIAVALACCQIGAVCVPLPLILREREVAFALELVESPIFIVVDRLRDFDHGEMAVRLASRIPTLERVIVLGSPVEGASSFDELLVAPPAGSARERERDADQVAEILFTSGTTGEPKGVMHTYNTQHTRIRTIHETLALTDADSIVIGLTLAHAAGWEYGFLAPIAGGMTVVLQDIWDPAAMLEIVERERITWSFGTTPFLIDAVRAQRECPRDTSSLRYFVSGGAAIPPKLVHDVADSLGARVMAVWGQTENGAPTCTRYDDPPDSAATSDGRALEWIDVGIFDEDDREVGPGEVGELRVRGATLAVGYFKRPDLFDALLTSDGWFCSGDLARMDERRYVRIVGRKKDIIVRGGENVPVVEIESLLIDHPDIAEVAVVPYADERLGERVCAVVVARDGADVSLDTVQRHLAAANMSRNYWPERVVSVDSLPKTAAGKIAKEKVREAIRTRDLPLS